MTMTIRHRVIDAAHDFLQANVADCGWRIVIVIVVVGRWCGRAGGYGEYQN